VPPPAKSLSPEVFHALGAVRRRIYGIRASLEEGARDRRRLLDQLREAERELEDLRALLRAAERQPAAPTEPRLRRRRSA
jgi:hypothetical protein